MGASDPETAMDEMFDDDELFDVTVTYRVSRDTLNKCLADRRFDALLAEGEFVDWRVDAPTGES
jgi:hypothetical protein